MRDMKSACFPIEGESRFSIVKERLCGGRNKKEAVSKAKIYDYKPPRIRCQLRVMPPREIDVRISQGCGIHTDFGGKMDPRVKPEDDYKEV